MSGYEIAEDARVGIKSDRWSADALNAMSDERLLSEIIELESLVDEAANEVRELSDTLVRAVGVALERRRSPDAGR